MKDDVVTVDRYLVVPTKPKEPEYQDRVEEMESEVDEPWN